MSFRPLLDLATDVQQTSAHWGCIIYRTTYTPLSDVHFAKIIELIGLLIKEDVRRYKDSHGTPESREAARATLFQSYQPFVHDNKAQFDGMSLDDYLEAVPAGEERRRPLTNETFCVVIDDEVVEHLAAAEKEQLLALSARGTFIAKKLPTGSRWWRRIPQRKMTRGG